MTAPRRLLHVVRPAQGGIRQHVLNLLTHTDRARFTPSLAAPADFLAGLPPVELQAGLPLAVSAKFSPYQDPSAAVRLSRMTRQVDLTHAHGLRAGWIAALASLITPRPFLVTAHNLVEPGGKAARLGLRLIGRRAGRIIAVSQAVADGLFGAGVPASKIIVIPNGIDLTRFEQMPSRDSSRELLGVPAEAFVVGAIARLSPEKGVDVLLGAARLLPEMTVLAAGDGPQRTELTALTPPNARLLGRIEDTRVLLAAADVAAVPSRQEGQGIVALEAMAAGVPIVASRVGGLAEMLTDGETALLVPPDDPAALAAALSRLRDDLALRRHLVSQADGLVRQKFDLADMVRAVENVYEESGD